MFTKFVNNAIYRNITLNCISACRQFSSKTKKKHDFPLGKFNVALIGTPNVGKSSIFNRLVRQNLAIVSDVAGTTRDRKEASASLGELQFSLVDTGGFEDLTTGQASGSQLLAPTHGTALVSDMKDQIALGMQSADAIVFVIDAKKGVTQEDRELAKTVRASLRTGPNAQEVILLLNKSENVGTAMEWEDIDTRFGGLLVDCYKLGFGSDPIPFSAIHSMGLSDLHNALLPCAIASGKKDLAIAKALEAENQSPPELEDPICIALVGRPNVGKSTLLNSILGTNRSITGPMPGLTRDSVSVDWEFDGRKMRLIDTAGLRKRTKLFGGSSSSAVAHNKLIQKKQGGLSMKHMRQADAKLEDLSIQDSLRALDHANVVVVVVDVMAQVGDQDASGCLSRHDLSIIGKVIEEGRSLVIAANKCDMVRERFLKEVKPMIRDQIAETIPQAATCPIVPISALRRTGVDEILKTTVETFDRWNSRIPTAKLNAWCRHAQQLHPPPAGTGAVFRNKKCVSGPLKIKYVTQTSSRPPHFVLFVNRTNHVDLPESYERFLSNSLNEKFSLGGVPLRFSVRGNKNSIARVLKHRGASKASASS